MRSVCVDFDDGKESRRRVLSSLSLEVPKGQFVAVVGANGCGKTTILNLISGLVTPISGQVNVFGEAPQIGRADVGYMFARDSLLPWRTARHNVELGLELRGLGRLERRQRSVALLDRVQLASAVDRYPGELSQGMRQRVALARTWATDPQLLLMDEPFAALDAQTRTSVRNTFLDIWDETDRKTVLFVTHDLTEALLLADRVVTIARGTVRSDVLVTHDRPRDERELLMSADYNALHDMLQQDLSLDL